MNETATESAFRKANEIVDQWVIEGRGTDFMWNSIAFRFREKRIDALTKNALLEVVFTRFVM